MATVQMAGNGFGGLVQGNYGSYIAAADGTFTVDTRDAPSMLALGMTFVNNAIEHYNYTIPPAAASGVSVVGSGALSNGSVAVTANPDVPRQVIVVVGTGTLAVTAGSVAVTYVGNDGVSGTDTIPLAMAASANVTHSLSRGVLSISSIVVSGLVGGLSPWIRAGTTSMLAVPAPTGAVDFNFVKEYDAGATIAIGTASTAVFGGFTPTTAPNGTVTYSFLYTYVAPNS